MNDLRTIQIQLEETFNRFNEQNVLYEYLDEIGITKEVTDSWTRKLLKTMMVMRSVDIATLVGIMYEDSAQATSDRITACIEDGYIIYDELTDKLVTKLSIPSDIQNNLKLFQYPLPMVIPPNTLNTNRDTGYLTWKQSALLNNQDSEDDICLDVLNILNDIPLSINMHVVDSMDVSWNRASGDADSDTKKLQQLHYYNDYAKNLLRALKEDNDVLYLTHAYDRRGRIYPRGYAFNYQGCDWNKATVSFA